MRDTKTIFSHNLNAILDRMGLPKTGYGRVVRLAAMFDTTRASAQKWLTAGSLPDPTRYAEFATKLGCSLDELFLDKSTTPTSPAGLIRAEVYSQIGQRHMYLARDLAERMRWGADTRFYEIKCRVMEPWVLPGDYIAFCPTPFRFSGDGIYVLYLNGGFRVRHVQQMATGNYRMFAESSRDHPEELDASTILFGFPEDMTTQLPHIIGPVVARLFNFH